MIQTNRITSGFDIELQLGSEWFKTAINLLIDKGIISIPNLPLIILDIQITTDPNWDLQIDVLGPVGPIPIMAKVTLSDDGSELTLTFDNPLVPTQTFPFGALSDIAGKPIVVKVLGDANHESALCILANLKLQTNPQNEEPFPENEIATQVRGDANAAISFLPLGEHIAFGMGRVTFNRFANNIWHTELRANDGSHPLPDAENKKGNWHKVSVKGEAGKIKIVLEGEVPIDIWPDADVTITLTLTPTLQDGKIIISIETDTDVDTGILGDIFAAIGGGLLGGLIGFVIAVASGGLLLPAVLIGAGIGAAIGVITLEIAEYVVEGIVQKTINAKINGEPVGSLHCNENGIVQLATPKSDGGFNLSFISAVPSSIPIFEEEPEDEILYTRSLLVTSVYDDISVNSNGFAVAGTSGILEKFLPKPITISSVNYTNTILTSLTFRRSNGAIQELSIQEVFDRAAIGELKSPFKMFIKPEDVDLRIPQGKLACACLTPSSIKQIDTIVEEIEFDNGIKILVDDVIDLQDKAVIVVIGYQLIHPKDYNAYYRAKADFFIDNNLESLPKYED
jgi:hypothetical protein